MKDTSGGEDEIDISDVLRMTERLPIVLDWCEYKGEVVVAQFNYDRTIRARKPMFDLSYCMTKALNQVILQTVQWDKNKFKPCSLTHSWGNTVIKPTDNA